MKPPPSKFVLRTGDNCEIDSNHLLEVFGEGRRRFVAVLRGFGSDDWAQPTRCPAWSAHDVVRHLCDCNTVSTAVLSGRNRGALDIGAGFDPRTTPQHWMKASVCERPDATLGRLVATTQELLDLARGQLAGGRPLEVRLPYGQMDWTALVLHALWDSWLHERDVLLARGAEHPTDDDAAFYVAGYGLFIAAAVAFLFGEQVQEKLTLGGCGSGVFNLDAVGAVTLSASRVATVGPPAPEFTDALAGRGRVAAALRNVPSRSRPALSRLAELFNTPVADGDE
jgi:uncharacterized protein (TIGR03083 family)